MHRIQTLLTNIRTQLLESALASEDLADNAGGNANHGQARDLLQAALSDSHK